MNNQNNQNYIKIIDEKYKDIKNLIKKYYEKKLEEDKIKFNDSKDGGLFYKFKHTKNKEFVKIYISKMITEFKKESLMLAKGAAELAKIMGTETYSDNKKAYMLAGKTEFSIDYKVDLFNIYYDLVYIFTIITDWILNDDRTMSKTYYFDDKTIKSEYINKIIPEKMTSAEDDIHDFIRFNKLSVAYLLKCFEQKKFDLKPYLFFEDYLKLQKDRLFKHGIGKFKKSNEGQGKKRQGQQRGRRGQGKKRQGQQRGQRQRGGDNDKKKVNESIIQEYNKKIKFGATDLDAFVNKRFKKIIFEASKDNRLIVVYKGVGVGDGYLVKPDNMISQLPNIGVDGTNINENALCLNLDGDALTGYNTAAVAAAVVPAAPAAAHTQESDALNGITKIESVIIRIKKNNEPGYNSDDDGGYEIKMSNIRDESKELIRTIEGDIKEWQGQGQKAIITQAIIAGTKNDLSGYFDKVGNKVVKRGGGKDITVLMDLILLKIAFKKSLISYQSVIDKNDDNEYTEKVRDKREFSKYRTQFLGGLMSMFIHRSEYLENKIKYFVSSLGYSESNIIAPVINNTNNANKNNNIIKLQELLDKIDKELYKYGNDMNEKTHRRWIKNKIIILKKIKYIQNGK